MHHKLFSRAKTFALYEGIIIRYMYYQTQLGYSMDSDFSNGYTVLPGRKSVYPLDKNYKNLLSYLVNSDLRVV